MTNKHVLHRAVMPNLTSMTVNLSILEIVFTFLDVCTYAFSRESFLCFDQVIKVSQSLNAKLLPRCNTLCVHDLQAQLKKWAERSYHSLCIISCNPHF